MTAVTFSSAMILALLAGRKTQTRRLATSPLRRVAVGDRIAVREHWKTMAMHDDWSPTKLRDRYAVSAYGPYGIPVLYMADGARRGVWADDERECWRPGRHRQAMHMPRQASRLTLVVTDVRTEPLQSISREDAIAEGLYWHPVLEAWQAVKADGWPSFNDPVRSYAGLWNSLHLTPHAWRDNPDVVALTFSVERRNIDL